MPLDARQFERLGERIDDGAVFNQTFDHPMLTGIVDMDYADMTELAVDIADGAVLCVRSVVNPDKLGHLGPLSDVAKLPPRPG